ncbi:hypothetical protein SBRCBS47491_002086 [Sporothrix bragantina]|uniref:Uncharacterized protein n=1 Tax=Sporothrix bragantina TaxID=671064 RepID=A0ABP0B3V4_9PEZI
MPSNFRTYESQSRLLAAVLASNPSLKLNFKAIAQHYGSDSSQSAIEHRFRPIKKQASIIRKAVSEGKDAKDFANLFNLNDKDIAKYYGESTPQGIEFQFRAIKKDAKALRDAVEQGTSPLATRKNVPAGTGAPPSARGRKPKAPAVPSPAVAGVSDTSAVATAATTAAPLPPSAARRPAKRARLEMDFASNDDEDTLASDEVDYEQLDLTPLSTPSHRMTATAGGATTANNIAPVPFTPSTTMAAPPTAFFTDTTTATPALSTGVSPADNDSPENNAVFHTAVQHQRAQPLSFYPHNSVTIEDDDDETTPSNINQNNKNNTHNVEDDDDDDLYIIDTPSKKPKLETPAPPATAALTSTSTATLAMGSFDSWNSHSQLSQLPSQLHSQSQPQSQFTFDASGSSWDSMGFFSAASDPMASFAGTSSFYDNDDGI